jgi:hypothetical protein
MHCSCHGRPIMPNSSSSRLGKLQVSCRMHTHVVAAAAAVCAAGAAAGAPLALEA